MSIELLQAAEGKVKEARLQPTVTMNGKTYVNLFNEDHSRFNNKQDEAYYRIVQEDADFIWEFTSHDTLNSFSEALKIFGFSTCKFYYSGFSSQGDGACFEGRYRYTPKWRELLANSDYAYCADVIMADLELAAKCQRENLYDLVVDVNHSGRYQNSGSMRFSTESYAGRTEYQYDRHAKANATFVEAFTAIADTVYTYLEKEYAYYFKHDTWVENCLMNDTLSIWADERGSIVSHDDMVDMLRDKFNKEQEN